jgi:hypothetical protein
MRAPTYAVYWNEPDGPRYAGRVALGPSFAELAGGASYGKHSLHRVFFDEIESVRYEGGRLELRRYAGVPIRIGSVDGPGALRELADRLQAALAACLIAGRATRNGDRR